MLPASAHPRRNRAILRHCNEASIRSLCVANLFCLHVVAALLFVSGWYSRSTTSAYALSHTPSAQATVTTTTAGRLADTRTNINTMSATAPSNARSDSDSEVAPAVTFPEYSAVDIESSATTDAGSSSSPYHGLNGSTVFSKRPPRRPPASLERGECLDVRNPTHAASILNPLRQYPIERSRMSAVNTFLEEHTGDVMLGKCDCPLTQAARDGSSGAKGVKGRPIPSDWSFDCGAYDWRILSELAPWHGINVTHALLDRAYNTNTADRLPTYHFSINKGRLFVKQRTPSSDFHAGLFAQLSAMMGMLDRSKLPDVEWVMHYWDHAKVPRGDAMPVFAFTREASRADVSTPFGMYWNFLEPNGGFDLSYPLSDTSICPLFEDRREKLTWRGGCQGPTVNSGVVELSRAYKRARVSILSFERPDILDAGVAGGDTCGDPNWRHHDGIPFLSSRDICKHKYLLQIDGAGISGRSSHLFHSGSLIFKPDSQLSEHYYHLLVPWVHYIPVREWMEDLVDQVEWAKSHPKQSKCIAENGLHFAEQHLNAQSHVCSWWRLLTTWARQQTEGSRTDGFVHMA